jgi:exopolysaccharide biosynthesis polyprenyl glycosylphosphotransferase
MKRSELLVPVIHVALDALMLFLAFYVAYVLRNQGTVISPEAIGILSDKVQYRPEAVLQSFNDYWRYVLYLVPAMLVAFAFTGMYRIRPSENASARLLRIMLANTAGLLIVLLLFLFSKDFFIPRTTVLYTWLFGVLFVALGRFVSRGALRVLSPLGVGVVRMLVVGNRELGESVVRTFDHQGNAAYKLVEALDDVSVEQVLHTIRADFVDEVLVLSERYATEDLVRMRNRCLEEHVGFGFLPRTYHALQGASYEIREDAGLPIIQVRPTPLDGWGRIVKRLFDIVVSLLLIVLLLPLYVLIGVMMYFTSKGEPIVFGHTRIGRGAQPIVVSKFRTMRPGWGDQKGALSPHFLAYLKEHPHAAKEWKETMKLKNDPRISKLGRFLRATRLDELPQFFDVIRGDLSLVGPRPIVAAELEKFGDTARVLFAVRPGVTGPWQVAGGNSLAYDDRVRLNAAYIEHWNLGTDIVILLRTAVLVIGSVVGKILGVKDKGEAY